MRNRMIDYVIIGICILIIVGTWAYVGYAWTRLPEQIPTHFDASGNIDGYGGKGVIFLLPVMMIVMMVVLTVTEHMPQSWNFGNIRITPQNQYQIYSEGRNMLLSMKLIIMLLFCFMTVMQVRGTAMPVFTMPVVLAVIFGDFLFWMIRIYRYKKE